MVLCHYNSAQHNRWLGIALVYDRQKAHNAQSCLCLPFEQETSPLRLCTGMMERQTRHCNNPGELMQMSGLDRSWRGQTGFHVSKDMIYEICHLSLDGCKNMCWFWELRTRSSNMAYSLFCHLQLMGNIFFFCVMRNSLCTWNTCYFSYTSQYMWWC